MKPAERAQAALIGRMYYVDQLSKLQIADRTGISRFKVARILTQCLEEGIVTITITMPSSVDPELSAELGAAYGLTHTRVVQDFSTDEEGLRLVLGRTAAELLTEIVTEEDVLGIGWGRTLTALAAQLEALPACRVVQMTGVTSNTMDNSMELVRRITEKSGGKPYPIFAPLLLPDAATASGLLRQPDLAAAAAQFGTITKAVVAVGSWDPPNSQLRDAMSSREREHLKRLGVQAELCGALLDVNGRQVDTEVHDRMIAVDVDQLRAIPELMAVAGGRSKQSAVLSVLRSGLVNSLVTDDVVARFLLEQAASG